MPRRCSILVIMCLLPGLSAEAEPVKPSVDVLPIARRYVKRCFANPRVLPNRGSRVDSETCASWAVSKCSDELSDPTQLAMNSCAASVETAARALLRPVKPAEKAAFVAWNRRSEQSCEVESGGREMAGSIYPTEVSICRANQIISSRWLLRHRR